MRIIVNVILMHAPACRREHARSLRGWKRIGVYKTSLKISLRHLHHYFSITVIPVIISLRPAQAGAQTALL